MLTLVKSDLFGITARLRQIDSGYIVYFNNKTHQYEVHNNRQVGNSYCLTVPYRQLDARTVDLVNATRVQNAERLFAQIEQDNQQLSSRQQQQSITQAISDMQGRR